MALLIVYAVLSIFFSFLCSILEAALLSFTPTFLKIKNKEGKGYAKKLMQLKKDIDTPLIAILTVNTIAHTVGAILVGVQAEGLPYKINMFGVNFVGAVSAIMTLLILIVSEIIPKTIGATYWKSLGHFTSVALRAMIFPLKYTGIIWLLTRTTKLIGKSAHVHTMSREEFITITETAEKEGVFEENESTLIKNLLVFKSIKAKDVMTPFPVVVAQNEENTLAQFYSANKEHRFSRIPVFKQQPHQVTGFVLKDDVLEKLVEEKHEMPLREIKRDILVIGAPTPIPNVFEKLIAKRTHIALVVDEFGNTSGIVTMEDIIETLLGLEIMDESDTHEDMQVEARKNWERRAKNMGLQLPNNNAPKTQSDLPNKRKTL